jgi:serine/threonine-protein kinase
MPSLTCPKCGREVEDGAFACPRDGTLILGEGGEGTSDRTVMARAPTDPEEDRTQVGTKVPVAPKPAPRPPAKAPGKAATPTAPAREPATNVTREALESKTMMSQVQVIPSNARDPLIGTRVGDYLVEAVIGEGGVGLVYRATQPDIGKTVALKVLRHEVAENPDEIKRLLAEAKAVNAIRHRGIIDVFGFGKLKNGQQYIVMEFLEGAPLDEVIDKSAPLPLGEVIDMLDEVLAALAAAHRAGVVHRDLKPNNIFRARHPDGTQYMKLLDFGLAKEGSVQGSAVAQTRIHMAVGTPEYIAPEQACGMPVSPKTDLYALGVVTFEMLTGSRPFISANPLELLAMHVEEPAPTMASRGADLPEELEALIQSLLAKEPKDRPASADAVREALSAIKRNYGEQATRVGPSKTGVIPNASLADRPTNPETAKPSSKPASKSVRKSPAKEAPAAKSGGGGTAVIVLLLLALLGAGGAWLFVRYQSHLPPFAAAGAPPP